MGGGETKVNRVDGNLFSHASPYGEHAARDAADTREENETQGTPALVERTTRSRFRFLRRQCLCIVHPQPKVIEGLGIPLKWLGTELSRGRHRLNTAL